MITSTMSESTEQDNTQENKIVVETILKKSKLDLVNEIFNPDKETGISEWKTRDELDNTQLALCKNGNTRQGICFGINKYNWDINRLNDNKTGKIMKIRTIGYNEDQLAPRPIRKDIRKYFDGCLCIVCGNSSIIIDHKNDLYNDPRVLNSNTQTKEDFQALCNSCNLRKRQVCKKTRELGKRYKATNIPMLKEFGIDFIKGDDTLDLSNPDAMIGTYWYDPLEFMKYINTKKKGIKLKFKI